MTRCRLQSVFTLTTIDRFTARRLDLQSRAKTHWLLAPNKIRLVRPSRLRLSSPDPQNIALRITAWITSLAISSVIRRQRQYVGERQDELAYRYRIWSEIQGRGALFTEPPHGGIPPGRGGPVANANAGRGAAGLIRIWRTRRQWEGRRTGGPPPDQISSRSNQWQESPMHELSQKVCTRNSSSSAAPPGKKASGSIPSGF